MTRVVAVDVARGVALAGMMLTHLGPPWEGVDPPVWEVVAAGRAAPLFALLAGVSLTLVRRGDPSGAGSMISTIVRGLLLVALGLSLGSLTEMPILIILAFYGLLIVIALPFRMLPTRVLVPVTVAWLIVAPVALLALRIHHEPVIGGQPRWGDVEDPLRLLSTLVLWGGYPGLVWFGYVLVGLLIGRLDLREGSVAARLATGGAVLTVSTLGLAWTHVDEWQQLFRRSEYPFGTVGWSDLWIAGPHTSMPLNVVGATGSALLVIGLCALALGPGRDVARTLAAPIGAAGSMTLTLYTVHVVWVWRWTRTESGLNDTYGGWVLQLVVLVAAATMWRYTVGRGPLERVVRWVSVDLVARLRPRGRLRERQPSSR